MQNAKVLFLTIMISLVMVSGGAFAETNGEGGDAANVEQRPLTRAEILISLAVNVPGIVAQMGKSAVNRLLNAAQSGAETNAISCAVQDSFGATVTTVSALSQSGDGSYWFLYNSGGTASSNIQFIGIPLFTNSPLRLIFQRFNPTASPSTSIVTPFGVPFWGGNLTSGRWLLLIRNGVDPQAVCIFTVIP